MTIRRKLCPAVLLFLAAAGYGDPAVLLDESAYWRSYLQGGPMRIPAEAMKRDGEMVLGKGGLERFKRQAVKDLTDQGRKADDWMKEVYYPSGYLNLQLMNKAATTPPPADWAAADFDDADWSCYRKPFKMAKDFYLDGFVDHFYHVKAAYFRSRFELPDPSAAGELRLHLTYRGGVRALLNGREIGRGHLPKGPLAPDALAEPYPPEAYWALKGEHPGQTGGRLQAWQVAGVNILCPDMNVFARRPDEYELQEASKEVPGPYRRVRALGYGGRCWITRAGWDRIRRLRNRTLDVPVPRGLLRKGRNVLAVEVRSSPLHPVALR